MKNITRRGFILGAGAGAAGLMSLGPAGELVAKTRAKQAKEPEVSPA